MAYVFVPRHSEAERRFFQRDRYTCNETPEFQKFCEDAGLELGVDGFAWHPHQDGVHVIMPPDPAVQFRLMI